VTLHSAVVKVFGEVKLVEWHYILQFWKRSVKWHW